MKHRRHGLEGPDTCHNRLLSTVGLSIFSGAFGGWLRKLASSEEQNSSAQQEQEMRMHRFRAEEDQRRIDNIVNERLLAKLDSMPNADNIVADCLARNLLVQARPVEPGIKTTSG